MTEAIIRIFILLAIFAAVFLLSQVVIRSLAERRTHSNAINRRIKLIRSGADRERIIGELLKNSPKTHGGLPPILRTMVANFEQVVFASAVPWSVAQIMLFMAIGLAVLFLVVILLATGAGMSIGLGMMQLALAFAVALAVVLPYLVLKQIAAGRKKKIEQQFPVALDIFVRALRSGHPVSSAIEMLTEEMDDPIGSEFGIVSDEVTYGSDLPSALYAMAERWGLEDMRMFVVSLSVQSETGGNLAEILENLSKVIRERAQMFMKVRALSSEGRMTGWMLTILPIFAFCSVFLGNPSFYFDVAEDPIFIIGSIGLLTLYVSGVLIIRKMVDLKV
jgi:tight adherence protein B